MYCLTAFDYNSILPLIILLMESRDMFQSNIFSLINNLELISVLRLSKHSRNFNRISAEVMRTISIIVKLFVILLMTTDRRPRGT